MISDKLTLSKEISIHEDFEVLNLNDQYSMIQINSNQDYKSFKSHYNKNFNVNLNSNQNVILKNAI